MKCETTRSVKDIWTLLRVGIAVVSIVLSFAAVPAIAASSTPIAISILPARLGVFPVFRYRPSDSIYLTVSVDIPAPPSPAFTVDVYVGVLLPGGQIVSWVPDSERAELKEGLAPYREDVSDRSFTLNTPTVAPEYTFTGNEPFGLYLVFVFVVPHGGDPWREWVAANMVPIIYEQPS